MVVRSLAERTPCPRVVPPGLPPPLRRAPAVLTCHRSCAIDDGTRARWNFAAWNFGPSLTPFLVLPRFFCVSLSRGEAPERRRTVPLPSVEATDQLCAAYRPPRYSLQLPSVASLRVDSRRAISDISRTRTINVSPISRDRDAIAARAQATVLRVDGSSRNRVVKMAAAPTSATLFMNGKRVIIVRHGPRETGGGDGMARCAIFERVRDRTSRRRDGYGLPLSRSRATVSGSVRSVYEFSRFSTFTSDLGNASVIAPRFKRSKRAMETRSPRNKINVKVTIVLSQMIFFTFRTYLLSFLSPRLLHFSILEKFRCDQASRMKKENIRETW